MGGKLRGDGLRKRRLSWLAECGILEEQERSVLGVIRHRRYPERDSRYEDDLRATLRAVLDGASADERTIALLGITHACGLDQNIFPDIGRKVLKRRVEDIIEGQWAGKAVVKTIASIQATVILVTAAAT